MRRNHDIIDIEVRVIKRTEMAVLVKDESDRKAWLPLSEIEVHPAENGRTYQPVSLPDWLAEEKGLI